MCLAQGNGIAIPHLFHVYSRIELTHVSWIMRSRFLTVIKEIKSKAKDNVNPFMFDWDWKCQCELRQ